MVADPVSVPLLTSTGGGRTFCEITLQYRQRLGLTYFLFLVEGSYCVSGGQLASITLNSCVTDICGGISFAPATSYKCLL